LSFSFSIQQIGAFVTALSLPSTDDTLNTRALLRGPITTQDRYNSVEKLASILNLHTQEEVEEGTQQDHNTDDTRNDGHDEDCETKTSPSSFSSSSYSDEYKNGAIRLMKYTKDVILVAPTYHYIDILQINSIQINVSFQRSVSTEVRKLYFLCYFVDIF